MRKNRAKKRRQIANATADADDDDEDMEGGVRVGAGTGAAGGLDGKKGLQSKGRKGDLGGKGKQSLGAREAAAKKSKNDLARMSSPGMSQMPMGADVEGVLVESAAYPANNNKGKKQPDASEPYTV
jgi:hypothetical protein